MLKLVRTQFHPVEMECQKMVHPDLDLFFLKRTPMLLFSYDFPVMLLMGKTPASQLNFPDVFHEEYHNITTSSLNLCVFLETWGVPQNLPTFFSKKKQPDLRLGRHVIAQFGRWMAPSTRFSDHGSTDGCTDPSNIFDEREEIGKFDEAWRFFALSEK